MVVAASCCGVVLLRRGTGALHKVDDIMKKEQYVEILNQRLKISARKLRLGRKWTMTQSILLNCLENGLRTTKSMFWSGHHKARISILLTIYGQGWNDLHARQPTNMEQLYQFCQEVWAKLPAKYCEKLVYPKRLTQVIQFKGNSTKY